MAKTSTNLSVDFLFRALADATRLRLLNLIAGREICVCYFVEVLGVSQPKISRHLAYLRRAGVVAVRRDGKWMHYRLSTPKDETVAAILRETMKYLAARPQMRLDAARLSATSREPEKCALLRGAPRPRVVIAKS